MNLRLTIASLLPLFVWACAPLDTHETDELPSDELPSVEPEATDPALAACDLELPFRSADIVATSRGVVVARPATLEEPSVVAHRYTGIGCALTPVGMPIAFSELVDADDLGNVYGYPRGTIEAGVLPTQEALNGDFHESVVRVEPSDDISTGVEAPRGIWGFGVSADASTFWARACGPEGVFVNDGSLAQAFESPAQWGLEPNVLTDDGVLWSVGYSTCHTEPLSPDCGSRLTRTSDIGDEVLSSLVIDLGYGYQVPTLARCGQKLCGFLGGGIVVWNESGELLRTLGLADIGAAEDEFAVQVTGNQHGLYVLLFGQGRQRVRFLPWKETVAL